MKAKMTDNLNDIKIKENVLDKLKADIPEKEMHPGEILKNKREEKGLSLESVHEATKIPLDALRAIEEGYKIGTLSPFYINGFIKMYARHLNIEASQVLGPEAEDKKKIIKKVDRQADAFDFQEWLSTVLTRQRKQELVVVALIVFGLFLLFKITVFILNRKPAAKKVSKQVVKVDDKAVLDSQKKIAEKKAVTQTKKIVAPKTVVKPVQKPVVGIKKNVTLTVKASRDSWLQVKADGETVFKSILRKNDAETWLADEKIEISGKYINLLEFELNGKVIGTLGRKDRKAKRVIATKDGISVSK